MASIKKIAGVKSTTYRVMWRDTNGCQMARSFKTDAAAKRYAAWRTLNPDAPDPDKALRVASDTLAAQMNPPAPNAGPTVAQVYARVRAARNVSRARNASQDSIFNSQLARLHNTPVSKLRPLDVRTWMKNLAKPDGTPYAPATVGMALDQLRTILDVAVEDGHITGNPARARTVKAPPLKAVKLTETDVLTPGELAAVLRVVPQHWRALFAFMGYTGARLSEALGVTIDQLDMETGHAYLGVRVAEEVEGRIEIRHYDPKTPGSLRRVSVPAAALVLLAEHLDTYQPQPGEPLFGSEKTRTVPSRSSLRQRVWNPALAAAGITRRVPMRNLRHTAATHALTVMDPLAVAARLGHSKPTTTLNTYARFLTDPTVEERNNAALDAYLGESAALAESLT